MTPQQVSDVQASFAKVAPIAGQAATLFYGRLFETAPETRALFPGDMDVQGQKLMTAIATVVNSLGEIEAVTPTVRDLAKRHVAYGCDRSITKSSAPPCCGHWNRASATASPPMSAQPGRRPMARCRR
jgi:hemoglobin-like flavoprotein